MFATTLAAGFLGAAERALYLEEALRLPPGLPTFDEYGLGGPVVGALADLF